MNIHSASRKSADECETIAEYLGIQCPRRRNIILASDAVQTLSGHLTIGTGRAGDGRENVYIMEKGPLSLLAAYHPA